MKKTFSLADGSEYIELVKLLKLLHITETGGDGKECIRDALVHVNGGVELRIKRKLRKGDLVQIPEMDAEVEIV